MKELKKEELNLVKGGNTKLVNKELNLQKNKLPIFKNEADSEVAFEEIEVAIESFILDKC